MLKKEDFKPFLDDFQHVKSLVSSPDMTRPTNYEPAEFNFKDKLDKPYLSQQAKTLLEELYKYKTTYKPSENQIKSIDNSQRVNYISDKAKKILEEYKFSQKPSINPETQSQNLTKLDTSKGSINDFNSDFNTNFYALTEPFTFEAKDFEVSKELSQIKSQIEQKDSKTEKQGLSNEKAETQITPVKAINIEKTQFFSQKIEKNSELSSKKANSKGQSKVLEVDLSKKPSKISETDLNKCSTKKIPETENNKASQKSMESYINKFPSKISQLDIEKNKAPPTVFEPNKNNGGNLSKTLEVDLNKFQSKVLEVDLNKVVRDTRSKFVNKNNISPELEFDFGGDFNQKKKPLIPSISDIEKVTDKNNIVNNNSTQGLYSFNKYDDNPNTNNGNNPNFANNKASNFKVNNLENNKNNDSKHNNNNRYQNNEINLPNNENINYLPSKDKISLNQNFFESNKQATLLDKPFIKDIFSQDKITPIGSYSSLREKPAELQRIRFEKQNSISTHSNNGKNELKLKGFQVKIDNIINNCFSNFFHRTIPVPNSRKTSFTPSKTEIYSQGFFSSEEKTRAMPFFNNVGKEMETILKKIKTNIAQKTEDYTKSYQGDAELRKSRFINEIQQAVKSSLEELDQFPNTDSNRFKTQTVQALEKEPNKIIYTNNKNILSSSNTPLTKANNLNNSIDKDVIEEIVKKTTNEMVLSLMKSNLLENPSAARYKNDYLSRSVEDINNYHNRDCSKLTTNFENKKNEILNQIEYIDKEILQMEKREESFDKNSIEDNTKNSFLSSPLELPDKYFKPKIQIIKPESIIKAKAFAKTQTNSTGNSILRGTSIKNPKSPAPSQNKGITKEKAIVPKVVASRPNQKMNTESFTKGTDNFQRSSSGLRDFAERNKKWQESRELKLLKSKEKMDVVSKDCTFKPQLLGKNRWMSTKKRTLTTSVSSPMKIPIVTPAKRAPNLSNIAKTGIKKNDFNTSVEKPQKVNTKHLSIFEQKKLQSKNKEEVPQKQKPNAALSSFKKAVSQPHTTNFKNKTLEVSKTTANFQTKKIKTLSVANEPIKKLKTVPNHPKTVEKKSSLLKSPADSYKNETSIEESFMRKNTKNKNKNDKEEMKELVNVLTSLTKTLKGKKFDAEKDEKKHDFDFEMKIKTVLTQNNEKKEKSFIIPKIEGLEEIEKLVSDKALTEKVNQELLNDEEDEFYGKNINFDKYSGLLKRTNILTDQIKNALSSSETLI